MNIRAHIIDNVRTLQKNSADGYKASVSAIYGVYVSSHPPRSLSEDQLRDILIELASPLVGCLGRVKENDTDFFYYLRAMRLPSGQ